MTTYGWFQCILYLAVLVAITKPMGLYLGRVLDPAAVTFLDPVCKPFERLFYALLRIDPRKEQTWRQYGVAMLIFSLVSLLFTYGILRMQGHLPWHQNIDALSNKTPLTPDLAFNTAASFTTNTNWQNYGGENTMSYFSQMVGLASHNFWSAAIGIAIAAVIIRGIARDRGKHDREFLGGPGAHQSISVASDLRCIRPVSGVAGSDSELPPLCDRANSGATRGGDHAAEPGQFADHPNGAGGFADRHQNARHQRRRIFQRQRRVHVRKSNPAEQLHPDALDLRDPQRSDLLPRPDGQEPGARLGGVGDDDDPIPWRLCHLLLGRGPRQPHHATAWRGQI